MQLNQLQFLLAVSREGSYSKAAKHLGVSQSTISTAVNNLEDELGCLLLERRRNGILFTRKGEYILEKAEEIETYIDEIFNVKNTFWDEVAGNVYIASASHHYMMQLINLIIDLQREHSRLQISALDENNSKIITDVAQRRCLMGLLQINTVDENFYKNEIQKFDLKFSFIEKGRMCFSVGPLHPLYYKTDIKLSDFLESSIIVSRYDMNETFHNFFYNRGYKNKFMVIQDVQASRNLVEKSASHVIYLPECGLEEDNIYYNQHLKILEIPDFKWMYVSGWVTRRRGHTLRERKIEQLIQERWERQMEDSI